MVSTFIQKIKKINLQISRKSQKGQLRAHFVLFCPSVARKDFFAKFYELKSFSDIELNFRKTNNG